MYTSSMEQALRRHGGPFYGMAVNGRDTTDRTLHLGPSDKACHSAMACYPYIHGRGRFYPWSGSAMAQETHEFRARIAVKLSIKYPQGHAS